MKCVTCHATDPFMLGTEDPYRCLSCHDALVKQLTNATAEKILAAIDKDQKRVQAAAALIKEWRQDPGDGEPPAMILSCCADELEDALQGCDAAPLPSASLLVAMLRQHDELEQLAGKLKRRPCSCGDEVQGALEHGS